MRFRLRTLLLLPAILAFGVFAAASVPRSETLLRNEKWKAHYRGFGWSQQRGLFGKRYFKFTVDDLPRRMWVIHYDGGHFGDVECRYPDGAIALTGRCRVERNANGIYPLIDVFLEATSYAPDGHVAARLAKGSGSAVLFYPNGTKNWEMDCKDFKRVRFSYFDKDGVLLFHSEIQDGG